MNHLTAGKINIIYWKNCFVFINFKTTFANLTKRRPSISQRSYPFYHFKTAINQTYNQ